jgi:murein DD-endopeptidase MepM/ murein hydrolase activator NlpD
MAINPSAPPWLGPSPDQARQHEGTPFAELNQCGITGTANYMPVTKEQHYWPVRSVKSQYGRQVPCKDTSGKTHGNATRRFGAKRPVDPDPGDKLRWHCGVDLGGEYLDMVVACQSGVVVELLPFNLGTWAVMVQNDNNGLVFSYNEVEKGSWNEFKVARGSKLTPGQPIARIGRMGKKQSTMLHFEIYQTGTKRTHGWPRDGARPEALRDPTKYLLFLNFWGA